MPQNPSKPRPTAPMQTAWRWLGTGLAAAIGAHCHVCRNPSRSGAVCANCTSTLIQHRGLRCPQCARPQAQGRLCGACLREPPPFSHSSCIGGWAAPLDEAVVALKFHRQLAYARWAGKALWQVVLQDCAAQQLVLPTLIVPVPLYDDRLRERGFNQSWEIIKAMPAPNAVQKLAEGLIRVRPTLPQAQLSQAERWRNVNAAFAANAAVRGHDILLIDDVVTTSATVSDASRALLAAGALSVRVACVARAG